MPAKRRAVPSLRPRGRTAHRAAGRTVAGAARPPAARSRRAARATASPKHVLDARRDTADFRDLLYVPTLVEVPERIDLADYKRYEVPILDQKAEGACTGFALATVAHYLLRRRRVDPDRTAVSPRMLYEMAKRYDEWPGELYQGSSARGAMKGWHKHGVCAAGLWKYNPRKADRVFDAARAQDARTRPLGAYYRVNHRDLVAMHTALTEVGVLLATATVHAGWDKVGKDGLIPPSDDELGGHAFAIVAYDRHGFWVQNSWGPGWGKGGFGRVAYDDWLAHGTDVWVARLGVPIVLSTEDAAATARSAQAGAAEGYSFSDLRPHLISVGNDGALREGGTYGTNAEEVGALFGRDFDRVTAGWSRKRLLLYAHGGLVGEETAIQRLADVRAALLANEIYPVSFIWKTDVWTTLTNVLKDALARRRPEGVLDAAKDFMLDRLDDALEPIARAATGKLQWDEMKENALRSTASRQGAARLAAGHIAKLARKHPTFELHFVAHSAGSIFLGPLLQLLATSGRIPGGPVKGEQGLGLKATSCTLWAPACTVRLFKECYLPVLRRQRLDRFALFTLTDQAEQSDNCAGIYHKSLLYLVANAFEDRQRIPLLRDGVPILGMARFVQQDAEVSQLFTGQDRLGGARAEWVQAPNTPEQGMFWHSTSRRHGDFDDDDATVKATLARILDASPKPMQLRFHRSASSLKDRRAQLTAR